MVRVSQINDATAYHTYHDRTAHESFQQQEDSTILYRGPEPQAVIKAQKLQLAENRSRGGIETRCARRHVGGLFVYLVKISDIGNVRNEKSVSVSAGAGFVIIFPKSIEPLREDLCFPPALYGKYLLYH